MSVGNMAVPGKYPWPPPTLDAFEAAVDADPGELYLCDKLIPCDANILMSGRPKLPKKTWMAMAIAQALATGQSVAAFVPTVPRPTLFCELEGPRLFIRRRWQAIEAGYPGVRRAPIYFMHRYPLILNSSDWQKRLGDFVGSAQIGLVVIDTIAKASRGDENDSANVGEIQRALEVIRSSCKGTSVMYLHHLSKGGHSDVEADIDDEVRGSTAFAGAYDVHLALRTPPDNERCLWLIARAANGLTRYYQVNWSINEEPPLATLDMQLLSEGRPTPELLTVCANKLEDHKLYKPVALAELWALPGELSGQVRRLLVDAGLLSYTPRGWRAEK